MGHFGRRPIALAWYGLVFPTLDPQLLRPGRVSPFGRKARSVGVLRARAARAHRADDRPQHRGDRHRVAGAHLGRVLAHAAGGAARVLAARDRRAHAAGQFGQIYVPEVNWALMVACVALVAGFRTSDKLAAAYGMAVTGTMSITTLAYFVVLTRRWRWPLVQGGAALRVSSWASTSRSSSRTFASSADGGWVPFSIGLAVFTLFTTWMVGRTRLGAHIASLMVPLDAFLADVHELKPPARARHGRVSHGRTRNGVPLLLLHHFKHNQVLHETVVLLTITSEHTPFVKATERLAHEPRRRGVLPRGRAVRLHGDAERSCVDGGGPPNRRGAARHGSPHLLPRSRDADSVRARVAALPHVALRARFRATRSRRPRTSGSRRTASSSSACKSSCDVSSRRSMIELYTWTTPNGVKPLIMLEEIGLPHHVTPIDIGKGEQHAAAYLRINPNGKIPAMVDDGIRIFESGAISDSPRRKERQALAGLGPSARGRARLDVLPGRRDRADVRAARAFPRRKARGSLPARSLHGPRSSDSRASWTRGSRKSSTSRASTRSPTS